MVESHRQTTLQQNTKRPREREKKVTKSNKKTIGMDALL